MNKWIKYGVTTLVVSSAALSVNASNEPISNDTATDANIQTIDVISEMGGSKLKDRMITSYEEDMAVVYAISMS